jgi:hypothetical protein
LPGKQGRTPLFIQVISATPDRVIPAIARYGGIALPTSPSNEDEAEPARAQAQIHMADAPADP